MWNAVTEIEMTDMQHKESEIFDRQICTFMHTLTHRNKHCIHVSTCANTHLNRCLLLREHTDTHARTWISQVFCCVSSASVGASVSPPCSARGAIISWHTYPPLNDFSSSSASRLIKVESLMPFRDPTAFNCIHCHYENEWRQLRTWMFFHILTECHLMCLMIATLAAFDWRPWLGTRLITPHILYITFGFYTCSVSPFLTYSLSHWHGVCVAHRGHLCVLKRAQTEGKYKVSFTFEPVVSSCSGRTWAPRNRIRPEFQSISLDRGGGGGRRGLEINVFLLRIPGMDVLECYCNVTWQLCKNKKQKYVKKATTPSYLQGLFSRFLLVSRVFHKYDGIVLKQVKWSQYELSVTRN